MFPIVLQGVLGVPVLHLVVDLFIHVIVTMPFSTSTVQFGSMARCSLSETTWYYAVSLQSGDLSARLKGTSVSVRNAGAAICRVGIDQ
jgi:hypothetical protein